METIINTCIVAYTLLVTLLVEVFMYRKPISEKEIAECQRDLDRSSNAVKAAYGLDWQADAVTEILKSRKFTRSYVLAMAGSLLGLVFVGLLFLKLLTFANIMFICCSGIILICYAIIRLAESKLLAIGLLIFVVVATYIEDAIFTALITGSRYAYFYLCGCIAILAILTFIPRVQKFARSH